MSHTVREDAPLPPPLPPEELRHRTNVHGTVFAARATVVERLREGDRLLLVPDPPSDNDPPAVWVHVAGGDVLGYVPLQVAAWLAPWMLAGGRCAASVISIRGPDVASFNRIEIELERSRR
jgi:HIRAN domain